MKRKKKFTRNRRKHHQSPALPIKSRIVPIDTGVQESITAIIYQSELDYISRCILDRPQIETGGQLFGFYTMKGTPVVCYALGRGPNANHQITFFNQDIPYLQYNGTILAKEFALQHIGEWHSHHCLGLDHPSSHDSHTMISAINAHHLGKMLLCIGVCDAEGATLNGFLYSDGTNNYPQVNWVIKAQESPYRKIADERLSHSIVHPNTATPRLKKMRISGITLATNKDNNYLLRAYTDLQL